MSSLMTEAELRAHAEKHSDARVVEHLEAVLARNAALRAQHAKPPRAGLTESGRWMLGRVSMLTLGIVVAIGIGVWAEHSQTVDEAVRAAANGYAIGQL